MAKIDKLITTKQETIKTVLPRIGVQISHNLNDQLIAKAEELECSISDIIRAALEFVLEEK